MRSFFGEPVSVTATTGFIAFSGDGEAFLTILPAPGRSARPVRGGMIEGVAVGFCGEMVRGENVGIPEEPGLAVMMTSSALPSLLLGRCSPVARALAGPGEFSFLNDAGSLDLVCSFEGEPNLPLPSLEDGVEGIGELGNDLSIFDFGASGGGLKAGDDQPGDFC